MNKVINIQDKEYPRLLKEAVKDAPKKLYYKGTWSSEIFENCLAVVGSRRMTTYGRQVVNRVVSEIAAAGVTIVSGFMYGVDATSHRAAVNAGGRTIAVMPCGIDLIHPEYQEELYDDILKTNGLIVSEYAKDFAPALWTYPRRNRIVAGLCKAVLVVEAGLPSGSLITARLAEKYGRKIFAIPGNITSEVSKGTSQLLKEGAVPVTCPKDILEYYNMTVADSIKSYENKTKLGALEKQIMEQLKAEPLEIDALARILKISAAKIGTVLSLMQLAGLVFQEGAKYYINEK
ncbi:MAG: DNA-processing protein DprA [bacterium]